MKNTLEQLSSFIVETDINALPDRVIQQAKWHLLDTLGAALVGSTSTEARRTLHLLKRSEKEGCATVWGTDSRLSPRSAAFANGVAAHAFELDDTGGCDHSGAVVIPALLATLPLCECKPSGNELLTAMVIGYDVARRVLEACGGYSSHNGAGWHSTGTCGVFGAAAGCASLLDLNNNATASALGLSASFSGGLWAFIHDGSQSKKLHAARAAEGGLLAALSAQSGISGPQYVFDEVWGGFLSTLAGDQARPSALTDELGKLWKIERCSIKPYASCRGTHTSIDALGLIIDDNALEAREIESIEVRLSPFLAKMCGTRDIDSLASAQMSLPYALAARMLFGRVDLDAYSDACRSSAEIHELMSLITLVVDGQLTADTEPSVMLTTRKGSRITKRVDIALGSPGNQLSHHALANKFYTLANRILPTSSVDIVMRNCMKLDALDDLSLFEAALSCRSASPDDTTCEIQGVTHQ
ncbi:MmgE/PrpD family protein [Vreelandella olivaria]|uniref:MmgE/PrpD family protein n=1 Tax=Vreelandella olivaria TaxID=390919 RepID=UPI00201F5F0C|nr:MmgE/PrpD family protein [Halomonas olivaria]